MKAAVVTSFDTAPQFADYPTPTAGGENELVVDVLAAGLHPRVRSQADGSHYTSTDALPLVPGIDGVGRDRDGRLRFFILPDTTLGSMAEQTLVDTRRSVVLPDDTDPIAVAAATNPAMSSWIALRRRIDFQAGQNVLVLGATGNAGRMAVQVAERFGARRIVAAGRDRTKLEMAASLGATDVVVTDGSAGAADTLRTVAAEVDVVIDYLWGEPAMAAMIPIVVGRADDSRPLTWIQIGSIAGPTAAVPSAALRATRMQIVGSGQGSVSPRDILAELPALAAAISDGAFAVDPRPVALRDVTQAWADSATTTQRIVVVPNG